MKFKYMQIAKIEILSEEIFALSLTWNTFEINACNLSGTLFVLFFLILDQVSLSVIFRFKIGLFFHHQCQR